MRRPNRRIPGPYVGLKFGRADSDHGGWLFEPGPHVSEPKNSGHGGATQKVAADHLPTGYIYTTLPLLTVAAPPSLSCCRLQQVVALAWVDGVRALVVGLAGADGLAASQVPAVAALGGELMDLAGVPRRGHVIVPAAAVPGHLLLRRCIHRGLLGEWCSTVCWCKSPSSWESQEEGMMSTAASFSLSRKPRFIVSRKKPNSRRWCSLASPQLQTIYKAPHPVLCFASCNAEPAHNITKYFAPNLRWGCQSHRFAVNKGMSISSRK
jgi:hypothetical protein